MWFWCRERREAENTAADRAIISFTQKIQITQKNKTNTKTQQIQSSAKTREPLWQAFSHSLLGEIKRAECEVF